MAAGAVAAPPCLNQPASGLLALLAGAAGCGESSGESSGADAAPEEQQQRRLDATELHVARQLQALVDGVRAAQQEQQPQQAIPALLAPAPKPGSLQALIREAAWQRKQQAQAELCLSEAELRLLGALLEKYAALAPLPGVPGCEPEAELRLNYDAFCSAAAEAAAEIGPGVAPLLQASTFLRFERDAAGCISLPLLLHFISLHTAGLRLRLQLSVFDVRGSGYLTLPQLHRFLEAAVANAPMLQGMEPSFLPHYLQIASRKLLLFHGRRCLQPPPGCADGGGGGGGLVVRLSDLANSPVMAELQELLSLGPGAELERDLYSNWFSLQSAQRVLATFTAWDVDGNGTLSRSEFSAISQGAMSELFIARVFEEHVAPRRGAAWPPPQPQQPAACEPGGSPPGSPGGRRLGRLPSIPGTSPPRSPGSPGRGPGAARAAAAATPSAARAAAWPPPLPPGAAGPRDEMDLLAFADFVLAWDHRNQAAAVPYFFRIFDLAHRGYLTLSDLYTFFREIHTLWVGLGEYGELDTYDVLDEVMDMVKPAVPGRITRADLAACRMAGTVFSILSNVDQFYQYNYRETFMHQEGGGEGGGGGGEAVPA